VLFQQSYGTPCCARSSVDPGVWLVQSRLCIGMFVVVCGAQCDMLGTVLLCVAVIVSVGVGSVAADSSGESRVQVVVFRDMSIGK
jgi:hypothetical protein